MSQNFRLFHVSNLSVRNFRIFLLVHTGSVTDLDSRPSVRRCIPADKQARYTNSARLTRSAHSECCSAAEFLAVDRGTQGSEPAKMVIPHPCNYQIQRDSEFVSCINYIRTNGVFMLNACKFNNYASCRPEWSSMLQFIAPLAKLWNLFPVTNMRSAKHTGHRLFIIPLI